MSDANEKTKSSERAVQRSSGRALSPFDEMERMFDSVFNRPWSRGLLSPARWEWPSMSDFSAFEGRVPKVDVVDRDNEVFIRSELPGVNKEDLDISLSENSVTIRAKTRHEHEEEKGDFHRREISSGEFMRTIALPSDVVVDEAKAQFQDGLLELNIPKRETAKRRKIKVE